MDDLLSEVTLANQVLWESENLIVSPPISRVQGRNRNDQTEISS